MNWTRTLWHWYPCINSACACVCLPRTLALVLVQRLTRPLPALILARPFLDRLNGSPGLPGHSCNRFFIVWIIEFIAPGQSSKMARANFGTDTRCNWQNYYLHASFCCLTCYPLVNHRLSEYYPNTAFCYLLPLDRVCIAHTLRPGQSRPRTIACVIFCVRFTRPSKRIKTTCLDHEPYTHKNYQCNSHCQNRWSLTLNCVLFCVFLHFAFAWLW